MATKEVDQPVVDLVWRVKLGQFLLQGRMPYRVKRLAEVDGYDDDIGIGEEHAGDSVEEGDYSSCWRTGWTEGKLIGK